MAKQRNKGSEGVSTITKQRYTVLAISVSTNPILCTKSTKLTMLFYYIKMRTSSSPYHPFLQLTGALKWGTVWTSISTGVETRHGQSWKFVFY